MTTNTNTENKKKNPREEIPKTGRVGGDKENAWKTTQNNATPQNTPCFKDTKLSTTFAQRKCMHWCTLTLIQNTAGQEGALRHRTALQTLGSTPTH